MKVYKIIVVFFLISSISCKKERVCVCSNANGSYDAGSIAATKSYAKRYCKNLSVGETTCKLK
jgi:hypothetical protein